LQLLLTLASRYPPHFKVVVSKLSQEDRQLLERSVANFIQTQQQPQASESTFQSTRPKLKLDLSKYN